MSEYFSKEFSFSTSKIIIKKEAVLKSLDVPSHHSDPYVEELIDKYIYESTEICSPKGNYSLFENPEFWNNKEMLLKGEIFSLNKIVLSALKNSSHIAILVASIGDKVEQFSKQLIKKGNLLEGLIVDIVGSEIAEATTELIHKQIEIDMLQKGLSITNRYSPGYCDWPVSDQQKLFKLIGNHACGVQLTNSSLMIPIKSVSGFVGVGAHVKKLPYTCSKCEKGNCIYRDK